MARRWFTCTPIAFSGGPDFFTRDSGLLSRGFQALGIESRVVMPGEAQAQDAPDVLRTDYANLESAKWWRSNHLDGVVLYAWASPRFRKVAAAIQQAGIFLVLNQDNGGLISPLAGFKGWLEEQWILTGRGMVSGSRISFLTRLLRSLTVGLFVTDPLRAAHLKAGNVIACVSPAAAVHYRKLCRVYGGEALAKRVEVIPHPVESSFYFDELSKSKFRQVVCVGRWEDGLQKRATLMLAVIQEIVTRDPLLLVEVIGSMTPELMAWHVCLSAEQQARVSLRGRLERGQLVEAFRKSCIFYSPSAYESFGIAAGEALCCGCSVVAGKSPSMTSFEWFVSKDSGLLASADNGEGHLLALKKELDCWDQGGRNPLMIAKTWGHLLHANQVAAQVIEIRESYD